MSRYQGLMTCLIAVLLWVGEAVDMHLRKKTAIRTEEIGGYIDTSLSFWL